MPLSVFTIESVALILVIAKDNGTIARKTGSPFVQFISQEISQATSSLTFSTHNSILETRDSKLSRIENRVSRLEDRGSRDCQLTFERYCTYYEESPLQLMQSPFIRFLHVIASEQETTEFISVLE